MRKLASRRVRLAAALLLAGAVSAAQAATSAELLAQGDALWGQGRLDPAQKAFEAAVAADPKSTATRMRLAGFQLSRHQLPAAVDNYRKVISQEPKNAKAWIGMGMAYLHGGQRELAKAAFEEAIKAEPANREKLAPLMAKLEEPRKL